MFDSGLGGLTVAREVSRRVPGARLVYLADIAHVPYGPRPATEIIEFAGRITGALTSEGAALIVVACNMSSALALPLLARRSEVPLIGMIAPGARAAARVWREGPVGVLATEGTCASGAYRNALHAEQPCMEVLEVACPEFVPLVEAGQSDSPAAAEAAHRYLAGLLEAGCQTIVLGCTHYPWLLPALQRTAGPNVTFVDPAEAVAVEVERFVGGIEALEEVGDDRFAATGDPDRLELAVQRWLGRSVRAERWPLFDEGSV